MNTYKRRYRAIATLASVSIGLVAASACSYAQQIDATPAEAAAAESSAPTTSTPPTGPSALPTLGEVLAQDRFVPLAVALERSGLDQAIVNLEDFVLIAPTDAAFTSSGTDIGIQYSTLMNDLGLLEAVMRYHIARPSTNDSWPTLNGSLLDVDGPTVANIRRVDGIDVLDSITVRNGTMLVVSRLLLPASQPLVEAELPPN